MTNHYWPTTAEIAEVFAEEIAEIGGTVTDRYDDGTRLLSRSVLPNPREVGDNDLVRGGVAILATDDEIRVHPYLFRQVCSNGAIMAQAIQTRLIDRDEATSLTAQAPLGAVREAIRACSSAEAFSESAQRMRSARETQADFVLMMMPMIQRLPKEIVGQVLASIMERFTQDRDNSHFGLMNAVTSVARDTRDPDLRWRLEEMGGGIPFAIARPRPSLRATTRAELVLA